jgi:hypothetical protein
LNNIIIYDILPIVLNIWQKGGINMKNKSSKFKLYICAFLAVIMFATCPAVEAASNQWIIGDGSGKGWEVRLDSPTNGSLDSDVYHVHFYYKGKHKYCMRLDNLKCCDCKNGDRSSVPEWLMEDVMANKKVQGKIEGYNPSTTSPWVKALLVTGSGILVILAALNIATGPADDVAAWSLFLKAITA